MKNENKVDRAVDKLSGIYTGDYELAAALKVAVDHLRKAQPKSVIYSSDGFADGAPVYDIAECPDCGFEYEIGDKDWGEMFCPRCGQRLRWEDEGEHT